MWAPIAAWVWLLVTMGLSAGCGDSHGKQAAADRPPAVSSSNATATNDGPASKPAEPDSAADPAATLPSPDVDGELGFKHTLKSAATTAAKPSVAKASVPKTSVGSPVVAAAPATKEDRYADVVPAPAVSAQADPAPTRAVANRPATLVQSEDAGETPQGNPLRDPRAPQAASRPATPPQPAVTPDAVVPAAEKPVATVVSPQPEQKSELVIQTKPEETVADKSPSATPTPPPPATGIKPEPKEHSLEPTGTGPRTNKNSGVPFDPIKENGKIFEGWPKPKLALVITGNQDGYLEPCGCAGLERMKGGMSRRYSFLRELRQGKDFGWPVVGIDLGNIAKGFGKQAELKFQIAVNGMTEMHYSTVTLGPTDLHLPTAEVMALTIPPAANQKTMFVSGNVGLFAFDESLLPRTQLIATGYKMIGITAVVGKTYLQQLKANPDLKTIPPENHLNAAVSLLKSRANYLILLAQATRKEAIDLANAYPDFNLVVYSEGGAEPPARAEEIGKGGTMLVEVGEKGMYAVVLGMFDDPKRPIRYQRVTLDSRFPALYGNGRLDGRLPGPTQGAGAQRAGDSSAGPSAKGLQRRLRGHRRLQELP